MRISCFAVISLILLQRACGQEFQDLDFESASLSPIPPGQFGGEVSITNALPGWTGFLGTFQVSQVLQNNFTLGLASIDILGPVWSYGGIIEGQYTLILQPGGNGMYQSASVSQTGLVPADARSLQFKGSLNSSCSVTLGGRDLSLIPLGASANYTLYGADISSFAGQVQTLAITALAAPNTTDYFDSITFSYSAIPEPSALSLFAICVLGLYIEPKKPKTVQATPMNAAVLSLSSRAGFRHRYGVPDLGR